MNSTSFDRYNLPLGYYVYMYLREDNSPYYIGKGYGQRAWSKGKNEIGKPTSKDKIVIYKENLTNEEAKQLETELIAQFGRKDLGTGILRNKTHGGDGTILVGEKNGMFGRTGEKHHHYGKKRPEISGENNAMYGKKKSEHPAYGYTHNAERRDKISKSKRGVKRTNFDQSGSKNPMFGRTGKNNPNFGKSYEKVECYQCGKHISKSMFVRWHQNDKCKKYD